jgi:hypothetical protein
MISVRHLLSPWPPHPRTGSTTPECHPGQSFILIRFIDRTEQNREGPAPKRPNQFHETVNEFNEFSFLFSHQKKFTPHTERRPSNSVVIAVHQSVATAVSNRPEEEKSR